MAIFGAGSKWDNKDELKETFLSREYFAIGWHYKQAKDLYETAALLRAGDIIYLKSNRSGSRKIKVKAIGVVKTSFINNFIQNELSFKNILNTEGFYVPVKWIILEEFNIIIPNLEGKLTNIRSATIYEEHLPFVQQKILEKLFNFNFKNIKIMDYSLGQFITGIITVSLQVLQLWKETENVSLVQNKIKQFDEITNSEIVITEGFLLEQLIPFDILNTLKGRVDICWTDFGDAVENPNILPRQLDRYTEGLRECICRELRVIKRLNGTLPTKIMNDWWDTYQCVN